MYKHLNISITLCGEEESPECEISLDDVIRSQDVAGREVVNKNWPPR